MSTDSLPSGLGNIEDDWVFWIRNVISLSIGLNKERRWTCQQNRTGVWAGIVAFISSDPSRHLHVPITMYLYQSRHETCRSTLIA